MPPELELPFCAASLWVDALFLYHSFRYSRYTIPGKIKLKHQIRADSIFRKLFRFPKEDSSRFISLTLAPFLVAFLLALLSTLILIVDSIGGNFITKLLAPGTIALLTLCILIASLTYESVMVAWWYFVYLFDYRKFKKQFLLGEFPKLYAFKGFEKRQGTDYQKVEDYLNSKSPDLYTPLDSLLLYFYEGNLSKICKLYGFRIMNTAVFFKENEKKMYCKCAFQCHIVEIGFMENHYCFFVYPGEKAETKNGDPIIEEYEEHFEAELFFKKFFTTLLETFGKKEQKEQKERKGKGAEKGNVDPIIKEYDEFLEDVLFLKTYGKTLSKTLKNRQKKNEKKKDATK